MAPNDRPRDQVNNLATELKDDFSRVLGERLAAGGEIGLRKTFPPATDAVARRVGRKLAIVGDWPDEGKTPCLG